MGRCTAILGLLFCLQASLGVDWDVRTPLDDYVQAVDPNYKYEIIDTFVYDNISTTVYVVNMTSQQYLNSSYIDRYLWWHVMTVAIPHNVEHPGYGFLMIGGGDNNDTWIPGEEKTFVRLSALVANDSGCIGGVILYVPNQPVIFKNDPLQKSRTEDDQLSWTFNSYVFRNDDGSVPVEILSRFSMTKAAKAGLDTIDAVAQQMGSQPVDKFIVAGASKRGWTTWSLAATDRRVIAAVPLVFSLLKIVPTFMKHYQSLGGFSYAMKPYWENNITTLLQDPEKAALLEPHEDMWSYQERFTIPILMISATGDQFFQPDDTHMWFKDLPGWKQLLMVPNVGHSMFPDYPKIYETILGFGLSVLKGLPLPEFSWTRTTSANGGEVTMTLNTTIVDPDSVISVTGYSGVSNNDSDRRDFRLTEGDPPTGPTSVWFDPVPVEDMGNGQYRMTVDNVPGKFVGHFIEAVFPGPNGNNMWLTTEFGVAPDTLPYPPCQTPQECKSSLV